MSTEPQLRVRKSNESFDYWLNQNFISPEARIHLSKTNVLITPQLGHPAVEGPLFAEGAQQLLECFERHDAEGLVAGLCLGDAEYKSLSLRSYDIFLPDFIIERIVIPIYVRVMNGYVLDMIRSSREEPIIHHKVRVGAKDSPDCLEFSYRGPASKYDSIVGSTLRLIKTRAGFAIAGETEDMGITERIQRLSNGGCD